MDLPDIHFDHALGDAALDQLFREARTLRKWRDKPVTPSLLMAIYDLMRWGPTEANITPARFHFVVSPEAKARLQPLLDAGNRKQTMAAPATVIVGYDLNFPDTFALLAPQFVEFGEKLRRDPQRTEMMATRSAGLQGGYFMLAARALGLDCGPMSGFDRDGVDKEFFAGTQIKSYFLCNLGYGDREGLRPRAARLSFDEACKIL
ncbi:MAG: malonic semialdehyde reductase [Alphaproteobacteria bacterium]|nr:malonic semialdehyde reductase [Alphaproteobacteria bacterium]